MKKLIFLFALFTGFVSFAQGPLHIYNYSSYDLSGRLYANSPSNCLPEVFTIYSVPAGQMVDIKSFNTSNLSNPPVNTWGVRTSPAGGTTSVSPPSGLLVTVGNFARWNFYWFKTRYAGTSTPTPDPDFNMGSNLCGISSVDYVHGVVTQAKWYYEPSTNETTLIVEDI
ncbi:hypothetical protein [uncultured Chryseobacterium sp.]|uniref:hypothetical protein n=1 Tax=uncultured Chryseobacterium sp. TaxID=259322 RepID=UPI0025CF5E8D|nr:hypothetical protein [uncultured Chryseobacterium sp.]